MSLREAYQGQKVFITGASGFIGKHLIDKLTQFDCEIALIARKNIKLSGKVRIFAGSIEDKSFVDQAIGEFAPNIIFHLAAARDRVLTQEAFNNTIQINLMGTLNILFACRKLQDLKRVVILGTAEEYGANEAPFTEIMREMPVSAYSFSKQSATHLSQLMHGSFGLPTVVVRPSIAYGPGQKNDMFLPALIQSLIKGESFPMTLGEQTRDYIFIDDLVAALVKVGCAFLNGKESYKINGEIFNIGSGQPIRIADLVKQVEKLLQVSDLAKLGAIQYRKAEQMHYWLDVSKANKLLGWKTETSLECGLAQTIRWIREQKS